MVLVQAAQTLTLDALAPPGLFYGAIDPRIVALLKATALSFNWWEIGRWALIVVLGLAAYTIILVKLWHWFLESRDHRSSYQKWLDQKYDDEEQMEYLMEQSKKRAERKARKKRRPEDD
jgi:hypothetical protein